MLEILVHFEIKVRDLPAKYKLLKITAPDDARIQRITTGGSAPDWQADMQARRALGDAWLREMSTQLLAAPSAIVPETFSVLLNPVHPAAKHIGVVQATDHAIDLRLLG